MTTKAKSEILPGVQITPSSAPIFDRLISSGALEHVVALHRQFEARRQALLSARVTRQVTLDAGARYDFLPETATVRAGDWQVAPVPALLADRRVEITGPPDRKMVINALNSGARVFMADFEDSNSPTWHNQLDGQQNLFDAIRRTIAFVAPDTGKQYALVEQPAVLFVRPRGWHLAEQHVIIDGVPCSGALFDFGVYVHLNAKELLARGAGPFFYLPKLESHLEARLWNDVFVAAQQKLGLPVGTIKATVLIETLPAAFEMDEILFELRDHSAGLNCGRWDYIFSFIKKQRAHREALLPDRGQVTMDKAFLVAYAEALIKTCHRRGAHAMGGMAAQIPVKHDAVANEAALGRVRADKLREVKAGHDGTWVAHPALVSLAMQIFDEHMPTANQLGKLRDDVTPSAAALLTPHSGTRTMAGLRHNIRVGIHYLESWLRGTGCVPIYHLMEDAATAEISRAQVWQWLRHGAELDDGAGGVTVVDEALVRRAIGEELAVVLHEVGEARAQSGRYVDAEALFSKLIFTPDFTEFLTLPAYDQLVAEEQL